MTQSLHLREVLVVLGSAYGVITNHANVDPQTSEILMQ